MSSGINASAALEIASPASDAITPPLSSLMRDIHPGPEIAQQSLDPRLQGLLWLLIGATLLWLIIRFTLMVLGYRRWCRQFDGDPQLLVPRLQEALRHEALQRWPEARQLHGEAWLAFVDRHGGSDFCQFADQWSGWLYGNQSPTREQRAQLEQAYRRWGRTVFLRQPLLATRRARRRQS